MISSISPNYDYYQQNVQTNFKQSQSSTVGSAAGSSLTGSTDGASDDVLSGGSSVDVSA
jgi:hypothetical protein